MVVKKTPSKPVPSKKVNNKKKRPAAPASTRPLRDRLQKMEV